MGYAHCTIFSSPESEGATIPEMDAKAEKNRRALARKHLQSFQYHLKSDKRSMSFSMNAFLSSA